MEKWILKRTAFRLLCWIGAIMLLIFGASFCIATGSQHSSAGVIIFLIIGTILFIAGILLIMYARALNKWIELKAKPNFEADLKK